MPGAGGGGFSLRQILVLLLIVALTVFLVRQVAWHALLAATGGILFVTAGWGFFVFLSPGRDLGAPPAPFTRAGNRAAGGGWGCRRGGCIWVLVLAGLLDAFRPPPRAAPP